MLIKTLLNAGVITERTRIFNATYVDMDALKAEGETMIGDAIADEGVKYLRAINFNRAEAPARGGIAHSVSG